MQIEMEEVLKNKEDIDKNSSSQRDHYLKIIEQEREEKKGLKQAIKDAEHALMRQRDQAEAAKKELM